MFIVLLCYACSYAFISEPYGLNVHMDGTMPTNVVYSFLLKTIKLWFVSSKYQQQQKTLINTYDSNK
eukprot:m.4148 g.4148  ORF g.4148 m.4148 type:complete len:67 (-) comp2179_c0_seq1:464-664(-)